MSVQRGRLITALMPPNKGDMDKLLELRKLEKEAIRSRGRTDFWWFINNVLWPEDAAKHYQESFHHPICDWIQGAEKGARKLLLVPRQHRKTYITTIAHTVWRIVRDPNVRIILVSALDDTAQVFCALVKRQFQFNEAFLNVYPEMRVDANGQFGKAFEFTHPARTAKNLADPTFRSYYLGAPVAGRRADIIICDDIIEKKHVTTPEQADKALRDFNDLLPIVDRSGAYDNIFVIGTRWAFNDVYGALLGEERGDEATVKVGETSRWDRIVRHAVEDERGKPDLYHGKCIMDQVFSRESMLQLLEEYRQDPKRGEEDFWKQMMNMCVSPTGRKFEEEWFDTWVPRMPSNIVFSAILCDSATKDEQILMRGDFTVALMVHFDPYGHLYVTDGLRSDAMKGADLVRELLAMQQRCVQFQDVAVSNFVKEKVGEDTFFGWLRSEFNRQRLPLTTFPLKVRGQGKKYVRIIESLQHPAAGRQIHFVAGFPTSLHKVIVDEATHLGQWSHDDAIDALSLAFHPDIRVRPAIGGQEWRTPHTRPTQLSTADSVPSALFQHTQRIEGEEQVWRGRNEMDVHSDGAVKIIPSSPQRLRSWEK